MYDTTIWRKQLQDQPLDASRKKQIAARLDEIDGVLNQQLSDLKKMGPQHLISILTKVYSDNADLTAREQFEPYFGQDHEIQMYGTAERALNSYMRAMAWIRSAVKGQNFGTNQIPPDYPPIAGAILHDLGVAWGSRVLYELKVRSLEKIIDNLKTASKKSNWVELQKEAYNAKNVAETCLSDALKQRDKAEADLKIEQKSLQDLTKELLEEKKNLLDEKNKYSKEQGEHSATKKKWIGWARQIIGERKSAKKDLAAKVKELADKTTITDAAITAKDAAVKAKDTAEKNFADLKPKYETLSTDYAEVMKHFSAATATVTDMLGENTELYEEIKVLNTNIRRLEAVFKVEKERADGLEKQIDKKDIALSNTKSKVRIGWYSAVGATATAAVLAFIAYVTPSQPQQVAKTEQTVAKVDPPKVEQKPVPPPKVDPPKVEPPKVVPPKVEPPKVDPPKVEIKPVPPSLVEPRNESMRYLMGAYLLELPDNQFIISSKKDAELEKRAKSVRYLASAYIIELDNRQFALTDEGKSLLEKQIGSEKSKLGRDLKVAEKKVLYEKFAARYVN